MKIKCKTESRSILQIAYSGRSINSPLTGFVLKIVKDKTYTWTI